jgi:hypothetical protein
MWLLDVNMPLRTVEEALRILVNIAEQARAKTPSDLMGK